MRQHGQLIAGDWQHTMIRAVTGSQNVKGCGPVIGAMRESQTEQDQNVTEQVKRYRSLDKWYIL